MADEEQDQQPPANPLEPHEEEQGAAEQTPLPMLMLGALGIVFGDIGTSPIYAVREALANVAEPGHVAAADVLGILSLIFWSLTLVVTAKYVAFVLRADNHGEGGTLSLMALARSGTNQSMVVFWLGVAGASLFFGDAVITPAISVLSAIEGLEVVTPAFTPYVVPITIVILLALFFVQRFGTGSVGRVFGPVTAVWFLVLGVSGIVHIFDNLSVFAALNPYYAASFMARNAGMAFVTLGAVFLAVTGAEALYADLGHFGRRPIVTAWFAIVFPCLLLNYFGQGAYILDQGRLTGNIFFQMQPEWARLPVVLLATAATVIAAQAVISGAFSLTRQAIQLHLLPRFEIQHTSETKLGQIYLPRINLIICVLVLALVIGFERSSALASAYGIAVTGEMIVSSLLLAVVMRRIWKWSLPLVGAIIAAFLVLDISFFSANALKIIEGGWVSLAVAGTVLFLMFVWIRGSTYLWRRSRRTTVPIEELIESLPELELQTVPGVAVFLTSDPDNAPSALVRSMKHYKAVHEMNIIVQVTTAPRPRVMPWERAEIRKLDERFYLVVLTFGYMERPNIPRALIRAQDGGLPFDDEQASYFLSRRALRASRRFGLPHWQDQVYIFLARTSDDATHFFQIPLSRTIEIGTQIRF